MYICASLEFDLQTKAQFFQRQFLWAKDAIHEKDGIKNLKTWWIRQSGRCFLVGNFRNSTCNIICTNDILTLFTCNGVRASLLNMPFLEIFYINFDRDAKLCLATLASMEYQWTNRLKITDFWRRHDTTNKTDNKSTEPQLILLRFYTSKKHFNFSFAWYCKQNTWLSSGNGTVNISQVRT